MNSHPDPTNSSQPEQDPEQQLQFRDIKPTAMRILVLRELVEAPAALSLSELESRFEKADRVTLYRTLKTFEQQKLIHSVPDGKGQIKYALCQEDCSCSPADQHVHFNCRACGETFCLTQVAIPKTSIPSGFQVDSVKMVYQGLCPACGDSRV